LGYGWECYTKKGGEERMSKSHTCRMSTKGLHKEKSLEDVGVRRKTGGRRGIFGTAVVIA